MNLSLARRAGIGAVIVFTMLGGPATAQSLPPDFVHLRDIDPSIAQDMRYAGPDNFTGGPLPGYGAAQCVLRRDVAQALQQVQSELPAALSLKVYDCYRPERAVAAMARWAARAEDQSTRRFYPGLDKRRLFADGWISNRSRHSAGVAVDLTVVPRDSATPAFDARAHHGDCDTAQRAPDNSIDMGTGYDCFSGLSYTRNAAITAAAQANRLRLRAVMRKHGFRNYFREWWHFEFGGGAAPVARDVVISGR